MYPSGFGCQPDAPSPRTEIGLTTEAKESTESGEVGIPLRTLHILCTTSVQDRRFLKDVFSGGLTFEQCSISLAEGQRRRHDGLATWCNAVAPVFGKLVNQAMGA